MEGSLLRLSPPRPLSGIIPRTRLLSRIVADRAMPVVIIQAPAGHGKSTLMQQAYADCERRLICTGWLTLHDSDNDPTRLIRTLHALLEQLAHSNGHRRRGNFEDPQRAAGRGSRADWMLGRLIRLQQPVTLFIDEFQVLSSSEALGLFHDLLASLPPGVRMLIGSRTLPEVGLSRLLIAEQAEIVTPADLLFTRQEMKDFFATFDTHLSVHEIDVIHQRTEGWPAAVQLYRLSLANAEARKSLGDINAFQPWQLTEYLTDNVLSIHPHDVQRFFLETSPLVRMSGPLCDAIMGRADSRELLAKLEESGLFVRSLDVSLQWFQYHSLFAGFLRAQLHRTAPAREHEVHALAAAWFRDNGHLEDAIVHALAIQDYAFATECLETWSGRLVMQGNLLTIERWFNCLPPEYTRRRPKLLVRIAWALGFMRRHQPLAEVLALLDAYPDASQSVVRSMICILKDDIMGAKAYAEESAARGHGMDPFSRFEAGATAILQGHLALFSGELDLARDFLVVGRTCGKQADSAFTVLGSLATAAVNLTIQGRLSEAIELLSDAPADACLTLDQSVASAAYAASYIYVLYQSNQLDAARKLFEQSFEVIAGAAQVDFLAIACVSMIRLHDAQGNEARASALLEEAEIAGHAGNLPRLVRLLAWERVRRAILAGDIERAAAMAARIDDATNPVPAGWCPFSEETEGASINRIRVAMHQGRDEEVQSLLRSELHLAVGQGRAHRLIKLLLLQAIAQYRRNNTSGAFDSLREALQLARTGYIRVFLDEGAPAIELLTAAHKQELHNIPRWAASVAPHAGAAENMIESLLILAGAPPLHAKDPEPAGLSEPLSSRETEIVTLLARGMFNREIGERLFISENTVKFHLKNIYAKLGVKSRSQAIHRLRVGLPA
ncbi:LuxR family transcriptional regulator [Steroidobacter denitrificans]|uniref:LuxR family transcriptional regulator n=1 Tax=Steroidobacter denitrificans TaxID=465721 RepID=A0A127F5Q6_STEDE|nr:LuxR family transcriptional regulator [Steroidobacter denitrificans]